MPYVETLDLEKCRRCDRNAKKETPMSKVLPLLLLVAMVLHVIRPLGVPGLRRRRDFWKIAVGAIAVMMVTVLIRP
jgi:hypothetical protein